LVTGARSDEDDGCGDRKRRQDVSAGGRRQEPSHEQQRVARKEEADQQAALGEHDSGKDCQTTCGQPTLDVNHVVSPRC